jgi:hypothetical protein
MKNTLVASNNNSDVGSYTELEGMMNLARLMATSKVTIPTHLKNEGDCLAIVMQSAQWGMNPFSVAQKTFLLNGVLGYESQLVSAIINKNAPIKQRLQYEFIGNWDKVIGNTKEKTSQKGNTYRVNASTPADEKGCGVKVSATMNGENKPRELTLMFAQVTIRNSTLWAEDPKQQLAYLAAKKWARLYCPDVILGVYTKDEVEQIVGKVTIEDTLENEDYIQDLTIVNTPLVPQQTNQTKNNDDSTAKKGPTPAAKLFSYIKNKGLTDLELLGNFVTQELQLTKENTEGINLVLSDLTKLDQLIQEFISLPFYRLFTFIKSKGIAKSEHTYSFINDMLGITKDDDEEIEEILSNTNNLVSLINEFKQLEGITEFHEEEANLFNQKA